MNSIKKYVLEHEPILLIVLTFVFVVVIALMVTYNLKERPDHIGSAVKSSLGQVKALTKQALEPSDSVKLKSIKSNQP